jgi:hypothetical protein
MNLMCEEFDFIEPRQSLVAAFYDGIAQNQVNIIQKESESNGISNVLSGFYAECLL